MREALRQFPRLSLRLCSAYDIKPSLNALQEAHAEQLSFP
jgi:hypothetical protein